METSSTRHSLRQAVPPDWEVIVLADRGLYARGLFGRIVRLGWHPFLRINRGGTLLPARRKCAGHPSGHDPHPDSTTAISCAAYLCRY
ncbi:MAG TPA: hypothetical protein VHB98_13350 [Chloroflexota bacterium]|nr:hypothetical protein [Chloroflexota bacterium]